MKKFLIALLLFPSLLLAQVVPNPSYNQTKVQTFTANLAQVAATYDLATAGADVVIKSIGIFVSTAATGLTSITMQSNNNTSDVVLASTLLAVITLNKNLTPVSLPFVLPSGKKIQYTIVGTGSAGALTVIIEYASPSGGTLS